MGCGAKKEFVPLPQVHYIKPANEFMRPTQIPQWQGKTNEDLINYILLLKEALILCNKDKEKIKQSVQKSIQSAPSGLRR